MNYKLEDIEKKSPSFKVPDNYFKDLPLKIQSRITHKKQGFYFSQYRVWRVAFVAAAALILTVVIFLNQASPSPDQLLAEVSEEALIAYLEEIEIDEYDIASAVGENTDVLQLDDYNYLDGVQIEDQMLDNMVLEYDLDEELL